jgi:chromosome segregation ATPase
MAATDTQLSEAERLTEERHSLHDRRLKLKRDLAQNGLDLLRCDPDLAPIADVIVALLEQIQQFEDAYREGAQVSDETQHSFEDKAELVNLAAEPLEFLRKRLYGRVVE